MVCSLLLPAAAVSVICVAATIAVVAQVVGSHTSSFKNKEQRHEASPMKGDDALEVEVMHMMLFTAI